MQKRPEPIEIKEPPIQEIQRKKTCFGRSCSLGCIFFLLLITALVVFIRVSAITHPKEMKRLPDSFPKSIPIYDKDAIARITVVTGKKKALALAITEKLPRPMEKSFVDIMEKYAQINDERNTYAIYWTNLSAEPKFIWDYYKTNLKRAGFSLVEGNKTSELYFKKDSTEGALTISDDPAVTGTDALTITALLPAN